MVAAGELYERLHWIDFALTKTGFWNSTKCKLRPQINNSKCEKFENFAIKSPIQENI